MPIVEARESDDYVEYPLCEEFLVNPPVRCLLRKGHEALLEDHRGMSDDGRIWSWSSEEMT